MIVTTNQLTKSYSKSRKKKAFTLNIEGLELAEGEFAAMLGPNGSGKSTFIKIMLGLVKPDAGTLNLMGYDFTQKEARQKVGYLPENFSFPKFLTVRKTMQVFGGINPPEGTSIDERIEQLASDLNIDYLDEKFGKLSKGMRQTAAIMHTLLGDHSFYILDEPLNGLDAVRKQHIISYLKYLREEKNISLLITTHILSDIEKLCDTIHLIKNGEIIHSASRQMIIEEHVSVEAYYLNYFQPQFGAQP
ncbi:MAG: ABC transporter ATP-binding protein [Balneolaceae bacterium]|nr:ABC transporter ATP-binding protein [Balneolaceae bacterium]